MEVTENSWKEGANGNAKADEEPARGEVKERAAKEEGEVEPKQGTADVKDEEKK